MQRIALSIPLSCAAVLGMAALPLPGATFYVDCASGSDSAPGTSQQAPWKSAAKVSATTFVPGDAILFRRGTRCDGALWPKGSGAEGQPIRLGAYGAGPLPVIAAGSAAAAVKLFDQQHWEIETIETQGGNPYGVFIGGTSGWLRHFRIRNVVVRGVTGTVKEKASGLVVIRAPKELRMEDIELDGVTAYDTTQWAGIVVQGGSRDNRARDITIRNSIAHNVYGDGIILFQVENGLVEKSAAWLTGLQPVQTIGTPNGIWTWRCRNCTVQLTEGFSIDSPGVDGGVYDIDWGNDDNIVQYNYGHDAMGYCASVFGASNEVTTNSIVRYNVCVNNGRSPKLAKRQGDIYLSTWEGGSLDGVLIHNNTIYWNPPVDAPAVQMDHADFTGSRPNLFANNVVYSAVPSMIHSSSRLKFQRNAYWYGGRALPVWSYGGREYRGARDYLAAAGDVAAEALSDPALDAQLRPRAASPLLDAALPLPDMGRRDAFGRPIPAGKGFDIGAIEWTAAAEQATRAGGELARRDGRWLLLLFAGRHSADSRSQVVFLQTAAAQYGNISLDVAIAVDAPDEQLNNLRHDWNLGAIRLLSPGAAAEAGASLKIDARPVTILVSPGGEIVRRWNGFVTPSELGLALRHRLGPPAGAPPLAVGVLVGGGHEPTRGL
ncbi:MAG: right-handed parallel beta-helix repeat-containing protein [Bryobacteraceae bacterium]|nr:right-handed parallel beta-helix repeat-containing protein [Bryobacteraceae bacterium]